MKHVFIINPNAGKKSKLEHFTNEIKTTAEALGVEYELYFTKGPKDCGKYARELCEKNSAGGEKIRIYGCGGDGTVNELVNGVYGFENVEIGVIPMGTGNDYIRNYGEVEAFLDIKGQILGKSRNSDLIKYVAEYQGQKTEGYCANMFNIGFDSNVVDATDKLKQIPLINGSLAYLLGIAAMFIKKKGADLKIEFEDGTVKDGPILLAAVANGCFCGGGIKSAPESILDDGLMDVNIINNVTRRFFASLFPTFKKGEHLGHKKVAGKDVIIYRKEKALTITANSESIRLCVDGELSTQKKVTFRIVEDAVKFIVPAKF
ncbi:MAG: diacylglycerol kinase family lipid kinase [Firmicutes bacterium]|nr:diacylglycerol kinase family lipid kinase [Bacillota bacterium]